MDTNYCTECLTSLYFDGMFSRRDQVNTALENTYQWIWELPNYKEWYSAEHSDNSSILWIKGKPGSGKSTLAKLIRRSLGPMIEGGEVLQSSSGLETYNEIDTASATVSGPKNYDGSSMDIVADYFFSSRSAVKLRSLKWMLQALLYQILAQNPKLYEHFRGPFHEVRNTNQLWEYANLRKIFLDLCLQVNQQRVFVPPCFYLVIDALDELENDENSDRADFLDILSSLCSPDDTKPRPTCILKILLISRLLSDIENKLRTFKSIVMHDQTMLDVEKIVTFGLESIVNSLQDPSKRESERLTSGIYGDDEDTRENSNIFKGPEDTSITDLFFLSEYLIEHANGIILWVVLIIRELRELLIGGFWTLGQTKDMLSSLPQDLEQCYEGIVRRIMKSVERERYGSQQGREQRMAKTQMMLSWVTFAYRPLNLREFRDVIAIGDIQARNLSSDKIDVDTVLLSEHRLRSEKQVHSAVLHFCGGFLESGGVKYNNTKHHSKTDILQLLHRSAKDFLLYNKRAAPFQLQSKPSVFNISLLAIKYLQLSLPAKGLPISPDNWSTEDFKRFINCLGDLPLLEYLFSLSRSIFKRRNPRH